MPLAVTTQSGLRRHLTLANTYRTYLRNKESEWPTDEELLDKPFVHRIVAKSLRVCLEDTEAGHKERKMVADRVEGRPHETQRHNLSIADLRNSAFAKAIGQIVKPPRLLPAGKVINGSDGATYDEFETVYPGDPRYRDDLPLAETPTEGQT